MLEFQGKFASCKVFVDVLEPSAEIQILNFLNCEAAGGSKVRFMPDVHAGAGCVIGFTATITDKIIPNLIGVDIGCGVAAIRLPKGTEFDPCFFDHFIRTEIPSGRGTCRKAHTVPMEHYRRVAIETGQDPSYVEKSLGSLGGGNHFIEVDRDQHGHLWVVVHSGSRNFGLKIANFHQAKAKGPTKDLEWLEGEDAKLYFDHMKVAQDFAHMNRTLMLTQIANFFGLSMWDLGMVESVHNYIDFEAGMIRKGAISANDGQTVIIPWNMRDGTIIGTGKGNEEWNCSAPHGAGRVMGRREAVRKLKMEDFTKSMEGIWSSCVEARTIDEAPMAYKDHEVIKKAIVDTVDVELVLKPVYNFKAQG